MGVSHGLVRALQFAFFFIVLAIAAYMVTQQNNEYNKHDHLAMYQIFCGVFGIFAVLLGLFAACNSSISIAIASILWDVIVAIMVLVGAILLSVNMKPSQCSNNNLYAHYTTSNWYFKIFSCTFTPLHRTLEAFLYLGFISLLTTMALNVRDMMKTKKNAKSEALAYPALPQSADRVLPESIDRKPRVAEVVEVA